MLFKDIAEVQEYVTISGGLNFLSLKPELKRTEEQIIRPYLGKLQYDALDIEYAEHAENIDEMSSELKALLLKVRPAVALLAIDRIAPLVGVQISDSGFQMVSTTEYKQAFPWMKNDARAYCSQFGYVAIDELLLFLDENAEAYPLWAEDPLAYKSNKSFLVNNADVFSKTYNISRSRLVFQAVTDIMTRVELFNIAPSLSMDFYEEIKTEIAGGSVSGDTAKLLTWLQPATVLYTMSRALFQLPLEITATGVLMNFFKAFQGDATNEKQPAPLFDKSKQANQCLLDADAYLKLCIDHLQAQASADKYATFFASAQYRTVGSTLGAPFKNTSDQKTFGFF